MPEPTLAALDDPSAAIWDELLPGALSGELVTSVYQPIVDLRRLVVTGFEALTRFSGADTTPDRWFAVAAHRGCSAELEAVALAAAAAHRADLPPNCFLAVNVEPETMLDPRIWSVLAPLGDLGGMVIEVTEHRPVESYATLSAVFDRLRGDGALIAVDDAGAGHAGLQQILQFRPSILKLDRALVAGVDRDEAKAALIEMLGTFASRIDAWLLAEGVETLAEAATLRRLGVPLAQGYLFARPGPPWPTIDPGVHHALRDQAHGSTTSGLHACVERVPALHDADLHRAGEILGRDEQLRWVAVVDELGRPTGVVTMRSHLDDAVCAPLIANVSEDPRAIAGRLALRRDDEQLPVLVHDDSGRYVGAVSVERLLSQLARTSGASRRGS